MTDDITHHDAVEGYCGRLSYAPGDELTVHVWCRVERYDLEIWRWGAERELVHTEHGLAGVAHPTPADADAHGCGWPAAVSLRIPAEWRSGYHHIVLRAQGVPHDRATGHAQFVLRPSPGAPRARALLVHATNTYHAYNTWGGRSLYTGGTRVSFHRPFGRGMIARTEVERDDRKSRPARWGEVPDADGHVYQAYRLANDYPAFIGSAGWFTYERRFVEWAEREGVTMDHAVSSDLDTDPSVLDGYRLVLGVGHDEYWSAGQRDALEAYVRAGGNVASLSGNTMFWQVRPDEPDADGTFHGYTCHKYAAHRTDPVVGTDRQHLMSGMWCDPLVGRPETAFLGAGSAWGLYHRFGKATARGAGAFTVYRDRHWLFEGTGLRYGDLLGARDGVVGYETVGCRLGLDEYQLPVAAGGDGTPDDIEVVAFCPSSNLDLGEYPASISALDDQGDIAFVAERLHGRIDEDSLARHRYGNAVMVVCRPFGRPPDPPVGGAAGGEVVTIGTTDWVFGLATDPAVARVTRNVLARYL